MQQQLDDVLQQLLFDNILSNQQLSSLAFRHKIDILRSTPILGHYRIAPDTLRRSYYN